MNLEEMIREMADLGELTHLSISPVQASKEQQWAVSFCAATPINGYTFVLGKDPVETMCRAIAETKLKRSKRKAA